MPLSIATNTVAPTIAVGVRDMVSAKVADLVFQNLKLFGLAPEEPSMAGLDHVWPVRTAGSTAVEAFAAGQPLPESNNQTWTYARLAYTTGYHRGVFAVDGHMVDAARGAADIFNIIDRESSLIAVQIRDLIHTTALGAGAMGIQLGIDSTGTYAGINRATTAAWGSEENASTGAGGSLLIADLELMIQELTDAERGATPNLTIASPTVATIVKRANAQVGGTTVVMGTPGGGATQVDVLGTNFQSGGLSVGGIPILVMPDLTNSVMLFLDTLRAAPAFVRHRAATVNKIGRRQDADEYDISEALLFKIHDPHYCGKITGIA